MKKAEEIEQLIIDHLSSDGNSSLNEVIKDWINDSPENNTTYLKYKRIWDGVKNIGVSNTFNPESAWVSVNASVKFETKKRDKQRNLFYASVGMVAMLLLIFGCQILYDRIATNNVQPLVVNTNMGCRSDVILPDGSNVKLNAGSSLAYIYDKRNKIRNVSFCGEAFFEVSKSRNPFVITTPNGLKVRVLGTKFNLRSYADDVTTETTLLEGKVELMNPSNKTITLAPGEIALFNKESGKLNLAEGNTIHKCGWLDNKLYLDNISLEEVCTRLERWYGVKIKFKDPKNAQKLYYTGVLSEESIIDVFEALSLLSNIKYTVEGKVITIN
jgi:ferric-dicitrate binding protein FerR (iron transport regulator)